MRNACRSLLLASLAFAASDASAEDLLRAPLRSFHVPGDGGWDYVTYDPLHDRVFVGRDIGVQVIDAKDGTLTATIGAATGDHGVALAPVQDRVFTSDSVAARLGAFTLSTLRGVGTIALPGEPDGLVFEPVTGRILAFIPSRRLVAVVEAATLRVVGTIDLGGEPEGGVADGAGNVYATIPDTAEVVQLDLAKMAVATRRKVDCARPSPIAIDTAEHRLFVGCRDHRMLVLDAKGGPTIATAPTGDVTDAITFDQRTKVVAVASGGGGISLIEQRAGDHYITLGDVRTPRGTRTMALDQGGGRLFTVTADIASIEPATAERPYPLLHSKPGSFKLIVVEPSQP